MKNYEKEKELEELKHKNKMLQLEAQKKNIELKFQRKMDYHRIKRADIQRTLEIKALKDKKFYGGN